MDLVEIDVRQSCYRSYVLIVSANAVALSDLKASHIIHYSWVWSSHDIMSYLCVMYSKYVYYMYTIVSIAQYVSTDYYLSFVVLYYMSVLISPNHKLYSTQLHHTQTDNAKINISM